MEYLGVILGNDLGYDPEEKNVVRREHLKDRGARSAKPRKGQVDLLDRLVKKYKTLMTQGMKGFYVYCCDEELGKYIRKKMKSSL